MGKKLVVVGGGAGGPSAAAKAKRVNRVVSTSRSQPDPHPITSVM
jgi:NADH dehydrogenase FAD-containing subunit